MKIRPDDFTVRDRPPGTPTELVMATLWADVLDLSTVGADDDFFELGGYSLLAGRITAEIARLLGVTVRAPDFYENLTVAELGALVDKLMDRKQ